MNVIEQRDKMIKDDLAQARESKEKAQRMLKEHEERMAAVKDDAANLLADAKKRARGEYDRIVADESEQAARIVSQADETARQTVDKAISGAEGHISELAAEAARKLLEQSSGAELNRSLYDSFLVEAGEGNDGE